MMMKLVESLKNCAKLSELYTLAMITNWEGCGSLVTIE
jgi:hypothetical protein